MNDTLVQLGVGGALALLIIERVLTLVFNFLKERKNKGVDLPLLAQQVNELYQWHSVTDDDGVKRWYVRRSLEEAIRELSANIRAQTEVLQELVLEQRDTRRDLDRLKDAS